MQLKAVLLSSSILTIAHAWSPTNSYAPATVDCADDLNIIRAADGLSESESNWVAKRDAVTQAALKTFLTRATSNFSDKSILNSLFSESSNVPRVAIAASGGGYRATFGDAGMVAAMDDRTDGANEHGLGGLLQGTTYLAAISGGSWFTSTVVFNNWTSVQDIINQMGDNDGSIWDIEQSALSPGGTDTAFTNQRFENISEALSEKSSAGFSTSLADVWGLAFSYYFFPSLPEGGVGYTWSTIQETDVFQNAEMPYLIQLGKAQVPGAVSVDFSSPTIEVTPYDFGSWEPSIKSFAEIKYLGTEVSNGSPVTPGQCVEGFDNVNFLIGTCTNLIEYVEQANSAYYNAVIDQLATLFLGNASTNADRTLAIYSPNPFKDTTNYESGSDTTFVTDDKLLLVDGGIDGQVIPFIPVMKQERDVDVVFALDQTADADDLFPNGDSLVYTYERQFTEAGKYDAFPYVPDIESFVELGLNKKPVFFGCDASNLTDLRYVPPLMVYLPNVAHSYASNISTLQLSFTAEERLDLIRNGFEAATMGNFTEDPDFLGCIGCAVMRRKQEKFGLDWPEECQQCFTNYCWDGSTKDDIKNTTNISSTVSDNSTTTTTTTDGASYTTILSTIDADELSTIHFETSTTITCHECEQNTASPTVTYTTITAECGECEGGFTTVVTTVPCEVDEVTQSDTHKYTTVSSWTTTTEVCSECEQMEAMASASVNSSSNVVNTAQVTSQGSSSKNLSSNVSENSQVSSTSIPSVLQVTTDMPSQSSSVYSVIVNENGADQLSLQSILTSAAAIVAFIGLI
ncbi:similar to Saccharomyces cerevisiae YOL011W PLB3 Phospholipase B (lysophospholipase) involved in phospholipid metabolism [Maudiozyma saulgeensis]|uniref:Lysophospholipase n=1 Tax=Maudiozyma saulgeensis TaxID=1789683 RepID=A0A1X7R8U7_9SACH|nr:similar to Saccharomyces cerevisiae YOL011W PLB3 Phospholipase B (lysophospholipase) involved in phospholipid metabolism [Kazachstania saulgeensis]